MTLNELIDRQGGLDRVNQVWNLDGVTEIKKHLAHAGIIENDNGQLMQIKTKEEINREREIA